MERASCIAGSQGSKDLKRLYLADFLLFIHWDQVKTETDRQRDGDRDEDRNRQRDGDREGDRSDRQTERWRQRN